MGVHISLPFLSFDSIPLPADLSSPVCTAIWALDDIVCLRMYSVSPIPSF